MEDTKAGFFLLPCIFKPTLETTPEPQESVSGNQTTTESTTVATESTPQEVETTSELPAKKEKKKKKHRHVDP